MMLCIDGGEIEALTLALGSYQGDEFVVQTQETFVRRLGNELGVIEDFLAKQRVAFLDIDSFGIVRGPGSAGALRSVVSLVNAWALARDGEVFSVTREDERWIVDEHAKPYVLPVYDRVPHTTVSSKDALRRKV